MISPARPDDILERLTRLYPKAIAPGLSRTYRVLEDFGDPHLRMPPVFHVAGTNGKGSTIAFLRAVLEAAGKTVHVMTSPHLVRFNERLVVSGRMIDDENLHRLLDRAEKMNAGKPATFFEITTAAGFLAFAENPADFCLIETGMGGRLDSTNVLEKPLASVITSISRDHMQFLGSDLSGIAREKAGIFKPGAAAIIGPQNAEAVESGIPQCLADAARDIGARLFRHGREWDYHVGDQGFHFRFLNQEFELPEPGLTGRHQYANAATALAAILSVPHCALAGSAPDCLNAVSRAVWPGRLQRLTTFKDFENLPDGWEIWLDGGHNEDGGRVLADQALAWQAQDCKPLHLIIGMLTTKAPKPFYDYLKPYAATAAAVPIPDEKLAFSADALAHALSIGEAESVSSAIARILASHPGPGRILIAGSLYLAGAVLRDC